MNSSYVYAHYKPDDDTPFYIGKGSGRRAWKKNSRNSHWKNVVKKYGYVVKILEDGLSDEEAFKKETEFIKEFGLDNLTNKTLGGDGFTSSDVQKMFEDPEHYEKVKKAAQRRAKNPEWLMKMAEINRKKTKDDNFRKRHSEILKEKFKNDVEYKNRHANATRQARAKMFDGFVSPTGEIFAPVYNLHEFCRERGLSQQNMDKVDKGKRKHHKGWTKYKP